MKKNQGKFSTTHFSTETLSRMRISKYAQTQRQRGLCILLTYTTLCHGLKYATDNGTYNRRSNVPKRDIQNRSEY